MAVKIPKRVVYTTGDVSRLFGVAPRTVGKWMEKGLLKGYRIPGTMDRRFTPQNVRDFAREHGLPLAAVPESARVLCVGNLPAGLAEAIGAAGFEVASAASVFEAGRSLGECRPACVVIDRDGLGRLETLQIVAALATTDTPFVSVGETTVPGAARCFEATTPGPEIAAAVLEVIAGRQNAARLAE